MAIKMADIVARVTSQTQYSSLLAGDQFGFKSAKQYGAVGDGITDDSAAILSLISAVSSSTSKALYFPTGVYKVDNVTLTSTHFSGYYLFGDNASFSGITKDIDQVGQTVGKLSDLNTVAKDSIVDAINELESESVAGVLTTRGDIVSHDSTGTIRVGSGTPLQYIVAGNTSDTTPLKYIDSPQKVLTNQGDILYASAPNTIGRVGIGTNLQNLIINATTNGFSYVDSVQKIMTAQGDMIYASSANNPVRLAKGTALQALIMNATTTAPQWSASLQSLFTAAGDIVYASTPNTPARLAKGTDGQVLNLSSGLPAWADKLTFATFSGSDSSTSISSGASLTKTISLGISAKFAIVTLGNASNGPYFRTFVVGVGSGNYKELFGYNYNTSGQTYDPVFYYDDTPTTSGISFSDIYISGTDLKIVFSNSSGGALTLYAQWKGGAIA